MEINLPDPGPYQVVVKQFASGVCHSQLHQIHNPRPNPVLLGHESTGVVLAKGNKVTHVQEGDLVLVTWIPRNQVATDRLAEATTLILPDGNKATCQNVFTWADHTLADEQYVVKADPDADKDVTSIIGCAVMTGAGAILHTAGVKKGESVAIFGVGGVGLSAVAAAKVVGADPIIAVDLSEEKLAFAKKFGATALINASKEDPVKAIRALTVRKGAFNFRQQPVSGVDYAFDCIGLKVTMEQILPAVRTGTYGVSAGGTAVLVGVPQTKVELIAGDLLVNEKKYIGSFAGSCIPDQDFPVFLDWHKKGKLDLKALVTERYALDQVNEAVAALEQGKIFGRAILEF
jgi:Zn-dependent alcohol dehydrogenase